MQSLRQSLRWLLSISDEQAMWRVQQEEDEGAFAQLVRRWEGPIRRVCVRLLGDEHLAGDLAQETFIRVFAKRKEFRADARFSTWVWRIAVNLCYDELRRRDRRQELSLDEPHSETAAFLEAWAGAEPAPDQALANRERGELVRKAVMRLPEAYRAVVVLRHYEDLKFREIADVLGLAEGTVKSRMAEALTQMNRLLRSGIAGEPAKIKTQDPKRESLMV